MSGGAENFCLKWQHFETNLSSAFQELRTEADFFDVTLVCGDGQHIEAHKVVLSACSVFFRDLLRKFKHPQPLLFLKGVKFSEIVSILNFMYEGEVTVVQDDLNSFLSVAEELKVKGLTKQESLGLGGPGPSVKINTPEKKEKTEMFPPLKRTRTVLNESLSCKSLAKEDAMEEAVTKHTKQEQDVLNGSEGDNSSSIIIPQPSSEGIFKDDITEADVSKGAGEEFPLIFFPFFKINIIFLGFDEIWSKLEKSGKIIRCRICGLNKHQDFFATLVNHIRKDHL